MHCVHSHCCSMFIYQNHCSCSEGDVIVLPLGYLIYEPASSDDDDHDGVQTWKTYFNPGAAEGGGIALGGKKGPPPLVLFIYLWQCPLYTSFEWKSPSSRQPVALTHMRRVIFINRNPFWAPILIFVPNLKSITLCFHQKKMCNVIIINISNSLV